MCWLFSFGRESQHLILVWFLRRLACFFSRNTGICTRHMRDFRSHIQISSVLNHWLTNIFFFLLSTRAKYLLRPKISIYKKVWISLYKWELQWPLIDVIFQLSWSCWDAKQLYKLGPGRIGYPGNFVSGSLSGWSIILLSLSGSGVLGYPLADIFLKIVISGGYPNPNLDP